MVEPEVVATSPNRIKSPVPVYCGFSSVKWYDLGLRVAWHCPCSKALERAETWPLNDIMLPFQRVRNCPSLAFVRSQDCRTRKARFAWPKPIREHREGCYPCCMVHCYSSGSISAG